MKKMNLILGIVCAFAVCLVSCTKEKATGRIQGIVTNMNTTEPIQGVNISLSPTGASAVTGSDGRYEFANLEPGNYTVQGVKTGFESNTKNITITSGNVSSGDMQLRPAATGFRLNVEYLDFGTNFSQLQFKIINASTNTPMSWEIMESLNWLETTPSTGNLQGGQESTITVNIDRSLLTQSTTANITVRSADQSIVLPVNVSVAGNNGPQLQLSETNLDFGTSANSLAFYVMNTGPANTSLNWICSNINVGWLTLSPTSGNTAGGASTQVIAAIDRTQISGMVSTQVSVSGAGSTSTITFSASASGSGSAILQLSEGSLDFGETATTQTFQVKNVGSDGTMLSWSINPLNVDWLTLTPMSGTTASGSGTLVTALVDRTKISGPVSTTVTVVGTNNSANLNVSASYVDNSLVVPDGLFCFFNFDGDEIMDYYGNYTGLNAGAEASTDTPSGEGKSMQFDGESAYIIVQDNIIPGGGAFTMNFWFKTGRNDQVFVGSDRNNYYDYKACLGLDNSSCIEYRSGVEHSYSPVKWTTNSASNYVDNRWHMLTLTFDGNTGMIFIDGVLFETKANNELKWASDVNTCYLGTTADKNGNIKFFSGKLDNFRSYNRALTAQEIQTLFNAKQ
ncbi:MAG: carboxypeptidase regulatory-like domain-containing protein [Bacteroidales bacterium]|nr:carboxypeptidase regulatory-like domain-containing protein [Bacteroidales bacterium]